MAEIEAAKIKEWLYMIEHQLCNVLQSWLDLREDRQLFLFCNWIKLITQLVENRHLNSITKHCAPSSSTVPVFQEN